MKALIEFAVFFVALGFTEAVLKPLAVKFTQRRLLAAAPAVLKLVDPLMPDMLKNCSSEELDAKVRSFFEEVTGTDWSKTDLTEFYRMYDVRKAAGAATDA